MTVTSLSVLVALFVGLLEVAQILVQIMNLKGGVFDAIAGGNFIGTAGFLIVGLFMSADA